MSHYQMIKSQMRSIVVPEEASLHSVCVVNLNTVIISYENNFQVCVQCSRTWDLTGRQVIGMVKK